MSFFVCAHRAFTGDPGGHCFLDLGKKELISPVLPQAPVSCLGLPHLLPWVGLANGKLGRQERVEAGRGWYLPCSLQVPVVRSLSL